MKNIGLVPNSFKEWKLFIYQFDDVTALILAIDLSFNGAGSLMKELYELINPYGSFLTIFGMVLTLITIWQDYVHFYGVVTGYFH